VTGYVLVTVTRTGIQFDPSVDGPDGDRVGELDSVVSLSSTVIVAAGFVPLQESPDNRCLLYPCYSNGAPDFVNIFCQNSYNGFKNA
jgi:hypothetical protein